MRLVAAARTDRGQKRPNNEDTYLSDSRSGLFIVADGMGGHKAGEVASALAVQVIRDVLQGLPEPDLRGLKTAVESANRVIYRQAQANTQWNHMGTTVVAALIRRNRLMLAHVGDSRAYRFSSGRLERLTDDHSLVFQWVKAGRLTEEEARVHPQRAGLLEAVGILPEVEVDLREEPYGGERILLCSDGLTDMLTDQEIEEILRSEPDADTACDRLIRSANEAGGSDNITVIVVQEENPPHQGRTKALER